MKMAAPLEPAIVCFDMEAMLRFYIDILGLRLVSDIQATPEIGKALLQIHGDWMKGEFKAARPDVSPARWAFSHADRHGRPDAPCLTWMNSTCGVAPMPLQ